MVRVTTIDGQATEVHGVDGFVAVRDGVFVFDDVSGQTWMFPTRNVLALVETDDAT